jgi:hypothetical protein
MLRAHGGSCKAKKLMDDLYASLPFPHFLLSFVFPQFLTYLKISVHFSLPKEDSEIEEQNNVSLRFVFLRIVS